MVDLTYLALWQLLTWAIALPVLVTAVVATLVSVSAGRSARPSRSPGPVPPSAHPAPPPPWSGRAAESDRPQVEQVPGPGHAPGPPPAPGVGYVTEPGFGHSAGPEQPPYAAGAPPHLGPGAPPRLGSGSPPYPGPGMPQHPAARRSTLYPNLLLGVACLFVLAAAVVFAGISGSAVLRAASIWAVALLSYAAGLLLHGLAPRLRPVGIALTGLGLALVPIAGGLLGGFSLTSPSLAWFIASFVGVLCYGFAAFRLRSRIVTWFGLLFVLSLVMSAVALTPAPTVWYFCALVVAATVFAVGARLLTGRVDRSFVLPHLLLGEVVAPVAVFAALFVRPFPSAWAWAALFTVLGIHYVVGAWLLGARVRGPAARLALAAAALCATGALVRTLWPDQPESTRWAAIALCALVLACVFYGETLLHRTRSATTWLVFGVASALGFIGTAVSPVVLESPAARVLAGGFIALDLVLVVLLVVIALRFDSPLARAGAVAFGVTLGPWVAAALGIEASPSAARSAAYLILVVTLILVLAADSAGAVWITSRRGRRLRNLRRTAPVMSAVTSGALLAPAAGAPDLGHPMIAFVGYLLVLLTLCAAAWAVRSALLLTGAIPLAVAVALSLAGSYATPEARTPAPAVFELTRAGLFVALLAGVAIAELLLLRAGRRWRARYAGIMALVLGAVVGLDAVAPVFPPIESDLGAGAIALGAAVFLALLYVAYEVCRRLHPAASAHSAPGPAAPSAPVAPVAPGRSAYSVPRPAVPGSVGPEPAVSSSAAPGSPVPGPGGYAVTRPPTSPPTGAPDLARPGRRRPSPTLAVVALWAGLGALMLLALRRATIAPEIFAVVTALVVIALSVHAAWVHRSSWILLPAAAATAVLVGRLTGLLLDDGALRTVLSAWIVWALWYACYWVLSSRRVPALAPLTVAFAAAVVAIAATPFLDVDVPWLHSVTQLAAGISVTIPALMLALLTARLADPTARRVVPEIASYIGAVGLMIALYGVVSTALVVNLHILVAAAWLWAWLADRRGDAPAGGLIRRSVSAAAITVAGVVAALVDGGWYTVLFLVDHVALLVYGAVRSRPWALWWGLGASVAAIVWFLRDLVWLALIVLALVLIGVVVWLLLRKPAAGGPGQNDGTRPNGAGPGVSGVGRGPAPGFGAAPGYDTAPGRVPGGGAPGFAPRDGGPVGGMPGRDPYRSVPPAGNPFAPGSPGPVGGPVQPGTPESVGRRVPPASPSPGPAVPPMPAPPRTVPGASAPVRPGQGHPFAPPAGRNFGYPPPPPAGPDPGQPYSPPAFPGPEHLPSPPAGPGQAHPQSPATGPGPEHRDPGMRPGAAPTPDATRPPATDPGSGPPQAPRHGGGNG